MLVLLLYTEIWLLETACKSCRYLERHSCIFFQTIVRLSEEGIVKIADFGMARFLQQEDYYRQHSNKPVPIKWMAPESVLQKIYTEESDVVSINCLEELGRTNCIHQLSYVLLYSGRLE